MQTGLHNHPFLFFLFPLIAGIACEEYLLPPLPVTLAIGLIVALTLLMLLCYRRFSRCFAILFTALLFTLGISRLSQHYLSLEFPFADGRQVCLVQITEHSEEKQRSVLYRARALACQQGDSLLPLPHQPSYLLYFPKDSASYTLQKGHRIAIQATMQPPRNFGEIDFDYARYLKRKGVAATAYVPSGRWQVLGKDSLMGWRDKAEAYREKVALLYQRLGLEGDELAVLKALTIGEKEDLSEEVREMYSVSGASHVLALSGLHVGLIAWLLTIILSFFTGRIRWLRPIGSVLTLILLGGFAYFTGLSPSVVRAVIMFSVLALVRLWRNEPLTLNVVAFTAFVMLCAKPTWLFDVGFQLSFAAVCALILFCPHLNALCPWSNPIIRKVWGLASVSLAAQLGTMPLVVYYFGRFSTHFLLTNFWIIPMVTLVLYIAIAMLMLTPFPMLQGGAAWLLEKMLMLQHKGLHWIESLPYASFDGLQLSLVEVCLLYLLIHAIYLYIERFSVARLRWLCIMGMIVAGVLFIE